MNRMRKRQRGESWQLLWKFEKYWILLHWRNYLLIIMRRRARPRARNNSSDTLTPVHVYSHSTLGEKFDDAFENRGGGVNSACHYESLNNGKHIHNFTTRFYDTTVNVTIRNRRRTSTAPRTRPSAACLPTPPAQLTHSTNHKNKVFGTTTYASRLSSLFAVHSLFPYFLFRW